MVRAISLMETGVVAEPPSLAVPRLGVTVTHSRQLPLDSVVSIGQAAEALGYESIWVPETWGADAVSLLAVLARETNRIKLASGVFNVYSRSAALIAQTAATLQDASHGRFMLGLGASGPTVVENWHGMAFQRPLERTREYIAAIRLALAGQPVDVEGNQVRLRGFRLLNLPAEAVPIYIAALGSRNVRLTGEIADGWLPIFAARGQMTELFGEFRRAALAAGRDPRSLDVAAYVPALVGRRGDQLMRQQLAYYIGGMGAFYADFVTSAGFAEEAKAIGAAWQAGDRRGAASLLSDRLLETCTAGSEPGVARHRLAEYRREGIALPVIAFPHGSSMEEIMTTLEALAPR